MPKILKLAGSTSEIWQIFVQDSSSTTGAGLTGLAFNTASLTCYYHRDTDTTATAVSLVTMTAGTFTSSGFVVVDGTNMPGVYQFCPPNAAIASGATSVVFLFKGATNLAPLVLEVQLTAVNPDSATAFVTSVATVTTVTTQLTAAEIATGVWQDTTSGDFTAASSIGKSLFTSGAVPGAAGGLFIAGTNAATVVTTSFTTTFTGSVTGSVASVTGAVGSVTGNVGGSVGSVTGAVGSVTGNVGGVSGVTFPATVASPTNITAGTITTVTNLTNAPTAGDFTSTMKTSLSAATPVVTLSGDLTPTMKASVTTAATAATPTAAAVTAVVSANLTKINGTTVNGNGSTVPWGP